jgi:hypothetical protein
MLDRAMPEPVLNSARIVTGIRQSVAAGVPQHVGVYGERQAGALTDALYKSINSIRGERTSALRGEHKGTIGELPVQLPQGPQLVSPERMNGRLAVLCPTHM